MFQIDFQLNQPTDLIVGFVNPQNPMTAAQFIASFGSGIALSCTDAQGNNPYVCNGIIIGGHPVLRPY